MFLLFFYLHQLVVTIYLSSLPSQKISFHFMNNAIEYFPLFLNIDKYHLNFYYFLHVVMKSLKYASFIILQWLNIYMKFNYIQNIDIFWWWDNFFTKKYKRKLIVEIIFTCRIFSNFRNLPESKIMKPLMKMSKNLPPGTIVFLSSGISKMFVNRKQLEDNFN